MIIPTLEVARLVACLARISDAQVMIMETLTEQGVHICGEMGFTAITLALDDAQIILEAVVQENPGGNDGQSNPS